MATNGNAECTYNSVPNRDENPATSDGIGKVKVHRKCEKRQPLFQKRRICVYIKCLTALFGLVFAILNVELLNSRVITMASPVSIVLKVFVSLSTLMLLGSVILYYFLDSRLKQQRNSLVYRIVPVVFEMIICAVHPFSYEIIIKIARVLGLHISMWNNDVNLTIPMFLRLYLLAQLVYEIKGIDQNPVTRNVAKKGDIKLNTWFVFKFYTYSAPIQVIVCLLLVAILACSWSAKVCEDFHINEEFDKFELSFGDAIYYILITFTTVGYGDIILQSTCGRFVAVFTGFLGICTIALLSAIFVHCLKLSRSEKVMFGLVSSSTRQKRYRIAASNAIKFYWLLTKRKSNNLERLKLHRKLRGAIKTLKDLKSKDGDGDINMADVQQLLSQIIRNQNQMRIQLGQLQRKC